MGFLQRLANLFKGGGGPSQSDRYVPVYVLSRRCNEPLAGQVDLYNELSIAEAEYDFYARKVLHTSGHRRCFDQVEVELWFDGKKKLAHHEVHGGRWLTAEEYATELARFNAPPEEAEADPGAVDPGDGEGSSTQA